MRERENADVDPPPETSEELDVEGPNEGGTGDHPEPETGDDR